MAQLSESLVFTPTWMVASVCAVIVLISLAVERSLHHLGKTLKKNQKALFEALEKLKEELMLLGFISLLLTGFQNSITKICVESGVLNNMLPCKIREHSKTIEKLVRKDHSLESPWNKRRLLLESAGSDHCERQGKTPLLSLEALHQLHMFIFVLAVVHVVFCATTMVLGGAKIRQWKHWEYGAQNEVSNGGSVPNKHHQIHIMGLEKCNKGLPIVSWLKSFIKQFHASVTKSDYRALRHGFIMKHCPANPNFDFHRYMMRTLEDDFKKVVGISWYLWLFVVVFLLLNVNGWHTYFWLSFLPLILLLAVGTKLEHILTKLAQEITGKSNDEAVEVQPSDELFWFHEPAIVLYLIHFILFQNAFEIGFFFWILSTYGFNSCIMESVGYLIPRLIIGVIVQVLCSYSTLPLYAIVTQMGSNFKQSIFAENVQSSFHDWFHNVRERVKRRGGLHSMLSRYGIKKSTTEEGGNTTVGASSSSQMNPNISNSAP